MHRISAALNCEASLYSILSELETYARYKMPRGTLLFDGASLLRMPDEYEQLLQVANNLESDRMILLVKQREFYTL